MPDGLPASAPRREHRSCRHHPQRARRPPSRSGARRARSPRGRRRRHHRPSARGPPPYLDDDIDAAEARARRCRSISRWRRPTRCWHRAEASARMPPAWCRRSARSAPPKAGSMLRGQHNQLKPMVERLSEPASACRCSSRPTDASRGGGDPGRAGRRAAHRRLLRAGGRGAAAPSSRALQKGRGAVRAGSGSNATAGHGLTYDDVGAGRGDPGDRRAQHRPFPDRRGDLRRARRGDPRDAPIWTPARAGGSRRVIIGIGNDLIDIRRIEKIARALRRPFPRALFTEVEQKRSDGRAERAATYAKRFAAKEACAKALGTGLRRGVFWRDMGVVNLPGGKPTMALTGGALARCRRSRRRAWSRADRPDPHRRFSAGAGDRHHLRRSGGHAPGPAN